MKANLDRQRKIKELREQGFSQREIAAMLGITTDLVAGYQHGMLQRGEIRRFTREEAGQRRAAIFLRTGRRPVVDQGLVQRLWDSGLPKTEIARRLGVSVGFVRPNTALRRLTRRQQQIVRLRGAGLSQAQIADILHLKASTVGVVVSRLIQEGIVSRLPRGRNPREER
jgi:DNA-binding CsgD family transcriptional regulator